MNTLNMYELQKKLFETESSKSIYPGKACHISTDPSMIMHLVKVARQAMIKAEMQEFMDRKLRHER